jgi:hypothetical protein
VRSFLGANQPQCEVNHSAPHSSEVKNEWSYTPFPQYAFMAPTGTNLPSP